METLPNVINFLKSNKAIVLPKNNLLSFKKIEDLTNELKILRKKFLTENFKELKQKIKKNYEKLRISALSLMEYDFHENSHSKILQYLIDYNSFETGAKVLSQMIAYSSIPVKEDLCKKIIKKSYSVYREHKISIGKMSGRIDLFILDEKEKYVIIIENKILAEIGETIDEDDNSIKVKQLEKYEKWSRETYPNYTRLYILLNYSNNANDTSLFEKISYA